MPINITPDELGFHRPFTSEVAETLKIQNLSSTPIAFKVKTTAPKQYCVRPNSGRIESNKEIEVTVLLQAMKEEPPINVKCRDKFLVQTVAIKAEKEQSSTGSDWQYFDDADKSTVWEKKIRVAYLPPKTKATRFIVTPSKNGASSSNSHNSDRAPPAYGTHGSSSPETTYTPEDRSKIRPSSSVPGSVDSKVSPKAELSNAPTLSYDEIHARLVKAEQVIASYAHDGGLRLRKNVKGGTESEVFSEVAHQVQQGSQGVPLQIVAALCFTSFLLAYLLF
ncbi:hypothetical protein K3495_g2883 [Podosphaera aphanis]|nr:hypothetical protein K3495_g2883 [Podosphaera aphanis]